MITNRSAETTLSRQNHASLTAARRQAALARDAATTARTEARKYRATPDAYSPARTRVVTAYEAATAQLARAEGALRGLDTAYSRIGSSPHGRHEDSLDVRDCEREVRGTIQETRALLEDASSETLTGDALRTDSPEREDPAENLHRLQRMALAAEADAATASDASEAYARNAALSKHDPLRHPPTGMAHRFRRNVAVEQIERVSSSIAGVTYFRETRTLTMPSDWERLQGELGNRRRSTWSSTRPSTAELERRAHRSILRVQTGDYDLADARGRDR
jgi:hypothetical protein